MGASMDSVLPEVSSTPSAMASTSVSTSIVAVDFERILNKDRTEKVMVVEEEVEAERERDA